MRIKFERSGMEKFAYHAYGETPSNSVYLGTMRKIGSRGQQDIRIHSRGSHVHEDGGRPDQGCVQEIPAASGCICLRRNWQVQASLPVARNNRQAEPDEPAGNMERNETMTAFTQALTYEPVETEYATDDSDPHDRMESVAIWLGEEYIGQFERFRSRDDEGGIWENWSEWEFQKQFHIGETDLFRSSESYKDEINRMLKALNAGTWNPG